MKKRSEGLYTIKQLRKAEGLTLQELARRVDIPYSTLHVLESGQGKNFNVAMKHAIADYFHVSLFSLFPEEWQRVQEIMGDQKQLKLPNE